MRLAFLAISLGISLSAKEAPQTINVDGLKVGVWLPKDMAGKPVVLFSHGLHGCSTQSTFLMQALADAGYAVFAPNHRDASCGGGRATLFQRAAVPLAEADRWTDTTYADRRDDIEQLIEKLPARYPTLDWKRIGLAGHSLGGYTVLGLAGGWASWKDPRIKAVLALSPYSNPFLAQRTLGNIGVPVMYQGGTNDIGITPSVQKNRGAYDQTPAPKYFVNLRAAGHFAWTDLRATYHPTIDLYSVAFFDKYLKGIPFPDSLRSKPSDVADLRIQQ